MPTLRAAVLAGLMFFAACSSSTETTIEGPSREETSTTMAAATPETVPPATGSTTTTAAAPTPTAAPGVFVCPPLPAATTATADRPTYDVSLRADPTTGVVEGTQTVGFRPDRDVDVLVFRLWANGPRPGTVGTTIEITEVTDADGASLAFEQPDRTRLDIPIGGGVAAGSTIKVTIGWKLQVNGPVNDRIARNGETLRLGSFLPLLAWQPGVGWATEPPTSGFAEATASTTADWRVRVDVPDGFGVLASGFVDGDVWVGNAMRDFALSVGRFTTVSATAMAPHPVAVTVGVHDSIDRPDRYLDTVVRSLEQFAQRFGRYPWATYSLAITPDLSGGIEFPAHVMQGPGTEGRTTPHEVAHMWFYGLVGNNQGLYPWIDEGLATYAEGTFLGTIGSMRTKSIPGDGRGRAGEPMTYWETRANSYYRSVYVQTAAAFSRLGPQEQVDCALAHLVARSSHRLATPADVDAALDGVFPDWRTVLAPAGLG